MRNNRKFIKYKKTKKGRIETSTNNFPWKLRNCRIKQFHRGSTN